MRKMTTITTFIQEISYLLDKGISFSIDEVNRHIENKDVVNWLEQEFPIGSENGVDFSLFKQSHRDYIHNELNLIGVAMPEMKEENGALKTMVCVYC